MSADIWLEDDEGERLEWDYPRPAVQNIANVHYGNHFNLTYNLTPMLKAAGMPPWREFIGMNANDAGVQWADVVDALVADPERFKAMNPANGWGTYEGAVEVLTALVDACASYPDAKVGGWL